MVAIHRRRKSSLTKADHQYLVQLEIAGPFAAWMRPDSGDAPVSYEAPTFSAVKGLLESVLFIKNQAVIVPVRVAVCSPVRFQEATSNYRGPSQDLSNRAKGAADRYRPTILADVCYKIEAEPWPLVSGGAHKYEEIFARRLRRQSFYHNLFLGQRDFVPTYVGPFRQETSAYEYESITPSMVRQVFNSDGDTVQDFAQNVRISQGVLEYHAFFENGVHFHD